MEQNELYPIFLKAKKLNFLIIGGGFVAEEKLTFLLKSSPHAKVTMVSPMFREGAIALAKKGCVTLVKIFIKKIFTRKTYCNYNRFQK
jgi:precorrin-2 dehydrogenase/sirohydrochlorin ferrochelatase